MLEQQMKSTRRFMNTSLRQLSRVALEPIYSIGINVNRIYAVKWTCRNSTQFPIFRRFNSLRSLMPSLYQRLLQGRAREDGKITQASYNHLQSPVELSIMRINLLS